MEAKHARGGLRHELRLILRRARQVWKLVPRRHKWALFGAAFLMGVTSLVNTAIPLFLGDLVDGVRVRTEHPEQYDDLFRVAASFLALIGGAYLLREALQVARRYFVENTCTRIDRDMTIRLVSHLMKADLETLTHEKVGVLHGRIARSIDGYVRFLRLGFLTFLPALLTGAFALTTALVKQPWLGLVMVGVIPTSVALTVWQLVSQKGVRLRLIRTKEEMDGTVVEQLGGLDYIRAADTHRQEVKRVAKFAERRRAKEVRHHFEMSLFGCAKALNEGLFHLLVLTLAIYLATRQEITFGEIFTFSMLFYSVMAPIAEIHRVIDEGHECSLQVGDLIEMLAQPTDRSFHPEAAQEPQPIHHQPLLEVEDLHVEYRVEDKRKHALAGISLAIHHGEKIGIAGRSGCGKSSWLRVFMRLTHPTAGRVRVAGVPLEAVPREAIGRLIGYVGQSPFVFAGTITENITYGTENATPEEVRRAAEMACLHDEIMALPGEYEAEVAERGSNLSGGQRQRLALARVFLKNPPILILDEGTSALDNISERHVQRALAAARADRTVIVVAHRLSTLLDADRILVFDNGRIVESGSYNDLVSQGGVFAELLFSSQEPSSPVATPLAQPA